MNTLIQRLLSKYIDDPLTGCWNWTGYRDKDGYGNIQIKRSPRQAHRVMYSEMVGPIPEGLVVRHTCDNPSCINPEHLLLGTNAENQQDKKERQRVVGSKHPYAKLTEIDVLAIRASPLSQGTLAKQYGVIQAHISRIIRRVNWTHI